MRHPVFARGELVKVIGSHAAKIKTLDLSPDGSHLISGGDDQTVKVWNLLRDQESMTLRGHTRTVSTVKFSQDGKKIFSRDIDGNLFYWDASNQQNIKTHRNDAL